MSNISEKRGFGKVLLSQSHSPSQTLPIYGQLAAITMAIVNCHGMRGCHFYNVSALSSANHKIGRYISLTMINYLILSCLRSFYFFNIYFIFLFLKYFCVWHL